MTFKLKNNKEKRFLADIGPIKELLSLGDNLRSRDIT